MTCPFFWSYCPQSDHPSLASCTILVNSGSRLCSLVSITSLSWHYDLELHPTHKARRNGGENWHRRVRWAQVSIRLCIVVFVVLSQLVSAALCPLAVVFHIPCTCIFFRSLYPVYLHPARDISIGRMLSHEFPFP